jgi:Rieske Fe-S protein
MASNLAYGPQIVTDSLVCCLDANNAKSYPGAGSTWYDLSGHGSNGVNTNATHGNGSTITATDSVGSYFTYDGNGDYTIINDDHAEMFGDEGEPSLTMNAYGTNGNYTDYGFSLYADNDQDGNDSAGTELFSDRNNSIDPNGWCQHLGTYSGNSGGHHGSVYFNGAHISTVSTSASQVFKKPTSPYNGGVTIASSAHSVGNTTHGFEGKIAIIRIYKRALSAAEIKQNFNANRSRFGL